MITQESRYIILARNAIDNGADPKDFWYIITQVWQLSGEDFEEGLKLWNKLKDRILT